MSSVSILHLTDLHFGQPDGSYFGAVEQQFFLDLRDTFQQIGGWDLIIIGGDIAYSGRLEEFETANKFFEKLLSVIDDLQKSRPPLLATPGNHDLAWADAVSPVALVLTELGEKWPQREQVWKMILGEAASDYHRLIAACFANYSTWWKPWLAKIKSSNQLHLHEGCLPGDFTACLTKGDTRIGIVGLNSSLLQLTGENFEGRLALHPEQLTNALPEKELSWFHTNDAALLLTHHPPKWLSTRNKEQFNDRIDFPGRFAVHLSGHLHEPWSEASSLGFAAGRRLVTGPSLFGFERTSNGFNRVHGYGTIKLEFDQTPDHGSIRYFPRAARKKQAGHWSFARDNDFDLQDSDGGTRAENGRFKTTRIRSATNGNEHPEAPDTLPPDPKPTILPPGAFDLPEINAASVNAKFVGRGRILEDFRTSLRGILARGKQTDLTSTNVAQLFWLHGFGGMGKSWFVRRACVEAASGAEGTCRVGLVDWHHYAWHRPASTPPRDPPEMFDAIAYRLTKIYGESMLDYWLTRERLASKWPVHRQWQEKLDEALSFLEMHGNGWKDYFVDSITAHGPPAELRTRIEKTSSLLEGLGIMAGTPEQVSAKLVQLRRSNPPHEVPVDGIFDKWAANFNIADPEVVQPTRTLAESLERCLRVACASTPLLLALDTCEILSQHTYRDLLHQWLRFLCSPLVNGQVPILIIAASRHRADSEVSSRFAWRDLIDPISFRSIDFDQATFTRGDIKQLLEQQGISPKKSTTLSENIYDLTRGVPLATATLLDYSAEELGELDWLNIGFFSELNRARALEKMYEVVAKRFILHLERRPDDFRDVATLALLLRAEKELLSKIWRTRNPHQRLHELTERYTLLLDGDLHPTVRDFLRQHWRVSPRPELPAIAEMLLSSHDELKSNDEELTEESLDWTLERLNLLSWTKGEDAYPDFARSLVVFLALGEDVEGLRSLACEIRPARKSNDRIKSILSSTPVWYFSASSIPRDVLSWIEREVTRSGDERERAYLELLRALQQNEMQQYDSAAASFRKGFAYFGTRIPRKEFFAPAYIRAVAAAGQRHGEAAKEAIRWCDSVGFDPEDEWNQDFYWILHNSADYERTREYCDRIIREEPKNLGARAYLGHVYAVHLNQLEEAESVFRAGLEIDGEDATLHYFLADVLARQPDRKIEAESEYLATLKQVNGVMDEARVKTALAGFYSKIGQQDKATTTFREVLKLNVKDPGLLNSYAWALYMANKDLSDAKEKAAAGCKLAPQDTHLLHTYSAILVRLNEWISAAPLLPRWLADTSDDRLKGSWHDFVLTFRDAVSFGHAAEFATMFDRLRGGTPFDLVRRALLGTCGREDAASGLSPVNRRAVDELARQMLGTDLDNRFPAYE